MIIHEHPLNWYVDKLARGEHFSQGMYGDAEWIAIFGDQIGGVNAELTVYTQELCESLRTSLDYPAENFYFSTPMILKRLGEFESRIDTITQREFVEKDVWDVGSRLGGLVPFIRQLKGMRTCIVSNTNLRRLTFLEYDAFIEVSYPNCFPEMDSVVGQARALGRGYVYLISAGLPGAIIAQRIHAMFDDVFALDVGSIWDAFIGIGRQRGWRKELYDDKAKYEEWRSLYSGVLGAGG